MANDLRIAGVSVAPGQAVRHALEHVESPADGLFVRTTTLSTVAAVERVVTVALLE
jgi:hypothetical protein